MSEDERPDKVIFVILTDIEKNSKYNREQIFNMIKEQEENIIDFIYLVKSRYSSYSTFNVNIMQ